MTAYGIPLFVQIIIMAAFLLASFGFWCAGSNRGRMECIRDLRLYADVIENSERRYRHMQADALREAAFELEPEI